MTRDVIEAALFLRMRYERQLPLFIVGESMGAALAVHCAARTPDLELSGLVLAAPGAISGLWRRFIAGLIARLLHIVAPNGGLTIERVQAWDYTPSTSIRLLSDPMVLRCIRPATLIGLFKLARSAVHEAEHVRVPVLTLVGERDDILRINCVKRLHASLGGSKEWSLFRTRRTFSCIGETTARLQRAYSIGSTTTRGLIWLPAGGTPRWGVGAFPKSAARSR